MNLLHLKPALLPILVLLWQTDLQPPPTLTQFRYQRAISFTPTAVSGEGCAVLDAAVFAHAAPSLKDLRAFAGSMEIPYSITVSEPPQQDTDDARIFNIRAYTGRVAFDLEMPHRPYTSVTLDLAPSDFIAGATVSGRDSRGSHNGTSLGNFTLFDLTSQHLARRSTIPLPESSFPYLHIELAVVPAPGSAASSASLNVISLVRSAIVPPSREAQSLYTATQQQKPLIQEGQESVVSFEVPARIPVERIAFTLPRGYTRDFSRVVKIEARGASSGASEADPRENASPGFEEATGTILHIDKAEAGHDLLAQNLAIPVAIGSNMQQPASVKISLDNGKEASLPLSVELEMRERRICFDAAGASSPLMLYYGDPSLDSPGYRAVELHSNAPRIAQLKGETLNPAYIMASPSRKPMGQRPVLRWIAALGCVFIFSLFVIRATHAGRR